MATAGYNEADTRAKLIDPALHDRQWIELVNDDQRAAHGEIHREQSAIRVEILDGKPLKKGRGRVDYLLRGYIGEQEQPLTLAFVEAKKEKLPPTQGLERVKEYARRHIVKFVYVMSILEPGGRCGIVLDEGLLYRTNEDGFIRTKRKWLHECDLWCIVSLPGGAFTGSGAGVKTNLVFFTKGRKTERIWYYDLSHIEVGKKSPLTMLQFAKFFELLDKRGTPEAETEHSWTVDFAERKHKASEEAAPFRKEAGAQAEQARTLRDEAKALRKAGKDKAADILLEKAQAADKANRDALGKAQAIEDAVYDLKAVNPREKKILDARTPAQLLEAIAERGEEVEAALAALRALL